MGRYCTCPCNRRLGFECFGYPEAHIYLVYLDSFKAIGITLNPATVLDEKLTDIKKCKAWATKQGAKFNQYVTYYCEHLEGREEFRSSFIESINKINMSLGVPEAFEA